MIQKSINENPWLWIFFSFFLRIWWFEYAAIGEKYETTVTDAACGFLRKTQLFDIIHRKISTFSCYIFDRFIWKAEKSFQSNMIFDCRTWQRWRECVTSFFGFSFVFAIALILILIIRWKLRSFTRVIFFLLESIRFVLPKSYLNMVNVERVAWHWNAPFNYYQSRKWWAPKSRKEKNIGHAHIQSIVPPAIRQLFIFPSLTLQTRHSDNNQTMSNRVSYDKDPSWKIMSQRICHDEWRLLKKTRAKIINSRQWQFIARVFFEIKYMKTKNEFEILKVIWVSHEREEALEFQNDSNKNKAKTLCFLWPVDWLL